MNRKIYISTIPIIQTNSQNFVIPNSFVNLTTNISYIDIQLKIINLSFTSSWNL